MNKKIIEVDITKMKDSYIKIEFNNYEYVLEKMDMCDLKATDNEDEMLEAFPGIFITKKNILRYIPKKLLIYVCNFRDEVKISLVKENLLDSFLYSSRGSRKTEERPCSNEELELNEIPLESIHFPESETGGGEGRCCLKGVLRKMNLYPDFYIRDYSPYYDKEAYLLFNYEEIFRLPDYISELRCECWHFCSKRNMENSEYDIVNGNKNAINKLINKHHFGAVQLQLNGDRTLSVINGNHRICFLKHFKRELSLSKIYFEKIYRDNYLRKDDIKKQHSGSNVKRKKVLDVNSYYLQLEKFGISKQEAREILLKGLDSIELYSYLKNRK